MPSGVPRAVFSLYIDVMRILIATGIYPPEVGGPARYASELRRLWKKEGDSVSVAIASRFKWLPSVVRQVAFLKWCVLKGLRANVIFALDTFSAAVPAFYASRILRKPFIVRVGGDFLWEMYTERTKKEITLRDFCEHVPSDLSAKERAVFSLTRKMLRGASMVVFSVTWYEELAKKAYGPFKASMIVENPNGPREASIEPKEKVFLFAGRQVYLKNATRFKKAFDEAKKHNDINLLEDRVPREKYLELMKSCYAVALPSLSDVSPNTALDAIRFGKPIILTKECGYRDRFGSAAVLVDPLSESSLRAAIELLSSSGAYEEAKRTALAFPCTRNFEQVASEIRGIIKTICALSS